MDNLWWAWMMAAAVFFIAEILTVGFFLLWFGIGAALAGLLALLGVPFAWQLVAFIVVSITLFVLTRRVVDALTQKSAPPGIGADRYVGSRGVVFETIDPIRGTGRVRIGTEEWLATTDTNNVIPIDTIVTIVRVDGTRVTCRRETSENS
jgi:membrane protein implicated in regulation of membrane protease activity